ALALAVALAVQAPPPAREGRAAPVREGPPRTAGLAWITVGALAGAAGLGLGLAGARPMAALEACPDCPPRLPPSMFAAVALNTASLGLLALGTSLRGRALGSHDGAYGRTPAPDVPWISLGG